LQPPRLPSGLDLLPDQDPGGLISTRSDLLPLTDGVICFAVSLPSRSARFPCSGSSSRPVLPGVSFLRVHTRRFWIQTGSSAVERRDWETPSLKAAPPRRFSVRAGQRGARAGQLDAREGESGPLSPRRFPWVTRFSEDVRLRIRTLRGCAPRREGAARRWHCKSPRALRCIGPWKLMCEQRRSVTSNAPMSILGSDLLSKNVAPPPPPHLLSSSSSRNYRIEGKSFSRVATRSIELARSGKRVCRQLSIVGWALRRILLPPPNPAHYPSHHQLAGAAREESHIPPSRYQGISLMSGTIRAEGHRRRFVGPSRSRACPLRCGRDRDVVHEGARRAS